jgi:hypothetical protein
MQMILNRGVNMIHQFDAMLVDTSDKKGSGSLSKGHFIGKQSNKQVRVQEFSSQKDHLHQCLSDATAEGN